MAVLKILVSSKLGFITSLLLSLIPLTQVIDPAFFVGFIFIISFDVWTWRSETQMALFFINSHEAVGGVGVSVPVEPWAISITIFDWLGAFPPSETNTIKCHLSVKNALFASINFKLKFKGIEVYFCLKFFHVTLPYTFSLCKLIKVELETDDWQLNILLWNEQIKGETLFSISTVTTHPDGKLFSVPTSILKVHKRLELEYSRSYIFSNVNSAFLIIWSSFLKAEKSVLISLPASFGAAFVEYTKSVIAWFSPITVHDNVLSELEIVTHLVKYICELPLFTILVFNVTKFWALPILYPCVKI